ncbi:MAG: ferritin-like domain-containing protein [Thermomicrobiales bacterium]
MTVLQTAASSRFSRRTVFKSAGVVGLGMTIGQARLIHSLAQEAPDLQSIINIAATAESLAVTLYGHAVESAEQGGYDQEVPEAVITIVDAARTAEYYHLEYLLEAGAEPLTQTFTVPDPALLTSYELLFTTAVQLETAFIAAYIAAARAFTALEQPELVKTALSVAAVEGEHRVLANYALGVGPANNIGFAPALFGTVEEAAQALTELGFIGGAGAEVTYPGGGGPVDRSLTNLRSVSGPSVVCTA